MADASWQQLNGDDDDDAALRRAIALSLGDETGERDGADSSGGRAQRHVIAIDDDSTQSGSEGVPAPAEAAQRDADGAESRAPTAEAGTGATGAPVSAPASLLGMDRRAMEAERLARRQRWLEQQAGQAGGPAGQLKRKADEAKRKTERQPKDPAPVQADRADRADRDDRDDQNSGQAGEDCETASDYSSAPPARRQKREPADGRPVARLPFPQGVVRKTWARGQPRRGDDMTVEEVWQKSELELAVLSSFQWDGDWLLRNLDVHRTKVLIVAYAADDAHREQICADAPSSNVRFCFPPMAAYGSQYTGAMHSKLQLLRYADYLRIVVPTGNLVDYDWGDTGVLENTMFIIDLPRLPAAQAGRAPTTPFLDELSYFLTAQTVDDALVRSLRKYDFAATARYAFVHTIPGSHGPGQWERTGYCGLGRAVQTMGWATDRALQLDYLTSSLGAMTDDLLRALYFACQGDSGTKEYDLRVNKARRGRGAAALPASSAAPVRSHIRVYFPSNETVAESRGRAPNAGSICFRRNWWEGAKFPREILRDAPSVRSGLLTHAKLIFVRREAAPGSADALPGWAYLGSANMSESAWGRLAKDKATGAPKLTCRNWECGVLIPAPASSGRQAPTCAAEGPGMLDMFQDTVPVPLVVPGSQYGSIAGGKHPWFFLENR